MKGKCRRGKYPGILFTACKPHSCSSKLCNCYSAYTKCLSPFIPCSLVNHQGVTGIPGPNSQSCCQLFKTKNQDTGKQYCISRFYIFCLFLGWCMTSKMVSASGKGIHPGKEKCFQDILWVRTLDGQNDTCEEGSIYSSERHACYTVVSRKRMAEEPSEIQRKFLKIFHIVRRLYTLRQIEITSSVVLSWCIYSKVCMCCFNFPGEFITVNNLLQIKFNVFHSGNLKCIFFIFSLCWIFYKYSNRCFSIIANYLSFIFIA